jgi:hypothetical protein
MLKNNIFQSENKSSGKFPLWDKSEWAAPRTYEKGRLG